MRPVMRIRVRYFALLRERAGSDGGEVAWSDAEPTLGRFREHLAQSAPALADVLLHRPLLCAVNREYAPAQTRLKDGDEVAFFPPVTGG
jgi:molybdopterin synthase sulfur carrier subunit